MYDFIDELEKNCCVNATMQNFEPTETVETQTEIKAEELDAKNDLETDNDSMKEEDKLNESDTNL